MQDKQEDNEGLKLRLEGDESFKKGDYKCALALYTKSLEKQETVDAFNNRAQTYIKLNRYVEAITDCNSVLKMENDDFKAHGHKGIALDALGCFEMALKEFLWCLEREPADTQFQKLHLECEEALDSKNFANLTLYISSYPGAEMKLLLVEGLHGYRHSHMHKYPTPRVFDNLTLLQMHLDYTVSASLGSIRLYNVTVDERLMEFFRLLRPAATLRCSTLEYFNVNSSKAHFDELFGGQMFTPMELWFYQDDDAPFENHFFSALSLKSNKLPVIEGAKSITLTVPITGSLTVPLIAPLTVLPEMSKIGVPFTGSQLDIDSCIDFLHTEYPSIPAHVRRSSAFCKRAQETVAIGCNIYDWINMLRSCPGRMIVLDFRYIGSVRLSEVIAKCKERFLSANHPISYSLHVRCVLDKIDAMDVLGLIVIRYLQQVSHHALRNNLGEQLRLFLMPSVTSNHALSIEEQLQAAKIFVLHIERVSG